MTTPTTFTYDTTTTIGLIRLRINDKYEDDPIFYDEELTGFLFLEANDLRKAAAMALETIAADEALVQKVIKLLSLSTNGAATAAELRANAALLRSQAASSDDDGLIDIAEWNVGLFNYDALVINAYDRLA